MLPFLVLVATIGLSSRALRQSDASAAQVRRAYGVREYINNVRADLVDAETGIRGYLLTGREQFLEPYWRGSDETNVDLYLLDAHAGSIGDGRMVRLHVLISKRLGLLERLRSAGQRGLATGGWTLTLLRTGLKIGNQIRDVLETMTTEQDAAILAGETKAASTRHAAFMLAVVGTPLAMFFALVAVLAMYGRLVRRFNRLETNALRLERGEPMEPVRPSDDEIGRVERALIQSGTLAIELREELQRLATVDPLTGLANRRGFLPLLELQVERSRRHHEPLWLMFLDLDGLKAVNDQLGHAVGDQMLCEMAAVLGDTFRASDVLARVGGDEFCVLVAAESTDSAQAAISRLDRMIHASNSLPGRPYSLAVSFGVAHVDPERPLTAEQLMVEADQAMYEHKHSKRSGPRASRLNELPCAPEPELAGSPLDPALP